MPHMLKQVLGSILTPEETAQVYSAFDQIGDIVIIKIPDELMPKKKLIAEAASQTEASGNVSLDTVHAIYAAFSTGDVPAILAHLAPDIDWE